MGITKDHHRRHHHHNHKDESDEARDRSNEPQNEPEQNGRCPDGAPVTENPSADSDGVEEGQIV